MDFVKRIICLEDARTRTQGLMPYFEFGKEYPSPDPNEDPTKCKSVNALELTTVSCDDNNGNWGQFVANPCFLGTGKTYNTMLHNYYALLNMVRNGVKLRKVDRKETIATEPRKVIFTEDVGAFEWVEQCPVISDGSGFEGGEEPEYLSAYAAYDANEFISTEIDSLREETRHIYQTYQTGVTIPEKHIVLIDDFEKFQSLCSYLDEITVPSSISNITIGNDKHKKWAEYCRVVEDCIGLLHVKASIYNKHLKAPKTIALADVKSYLDWLIENKDGDCCSKKLWEDKGGDEMIEFLSSHINDCANKLSVFNSNSQEYLKPFFEISLLLTQNFTDVGVLTNIDGVDYDSELEGPSQAPGATNSRPHGELQISPNDSGFTRQGEIDKFAKLGQGLCIDQIIMGQGRKTYPTTKEYDENPSAYVTTDSEGRIYSGISIEVESLLQTLRSRKKYLDDKNNVLPGLFKYFDDKEGAMFACVKSSDEKYYRLEVRPYTIYVDDQPVTKYRLEYIEDNDNLGEGDISIPKDAHTYPKLDSYVFRDGYDTEQEAAADLRIETDKYNDEENCYIVCEKDPTWEMKGPLAQKPKDCLNGDGKESVIVLYGENGGQDDGQHWETAEGKFYRTITTEAAGIRIAKTREEESGELDELNAHYFFMVKYHNSGCPMDIPYKVGNTANVYALDSGDTACTEFRGDILTKADPVEGGIEFEYVIGGFLSRSEDGEYHYESGGDVYREVRVLDTEHVDYVPLDGVDNVPVWSNFVDFGADAKEFYSPRYNLYRTGNTANIIKMTTGEYWNEDWAYDAYLAKEDYLINFSNPPKLDVNVTIDRGGTSVFERHYKLSECNTMQDLEQYHNGEFFENDY